jgi:hypothetical protein
MSRIAHHEVTPGGGRRSIGPAIVGAANGEKTHPGERLLNRAKFSRPSNFSIACLTDGARSYFCKAWVQPRQTFDIMGSSESRAVPVACSELGHPSHPRELKRAKLVAQGRVCRHHVEPAYQRLTFDRFDLGFDQGTWRFLSSMEE